MSKTIVEGVGLVPTDLLVSKRLAVLERIFNAEKQKGLRELKSFTRKMRTKGHVDWFDNLGMRKMGYGDFNKVVPRCFVDFEARFYLGKHMIPTFIEAVLIDYQEGFDYIISEKETLKQLLHTQTTMPTPTPTTPIAVPTTATTPASSQEEKAKLLLDLLNGTTASVNREDVLAIVDERLKSHVKTIEVKRPDATSIRMDGQHYKFDTLLKWCGRGKNVFLVGAAGSGKTTACRNVAKALSLDFFYIAISAQTTISQVFGYYDANGNYVGSLFRRAYENGGVFLLDEVDSGNANTLTGINAAIENGLAAFPDGMVEKHPNFVFVAAGNTWGTGADKQYVGRNQLDAAFLDRFIQIEWNYDEALELSYAPNSSYIPWITYVQKVRAFCQAQKMKVVISPRKTINGIAALRDGDSVDDVIAEVIAPAFTLDQMVMVENNVPSPKFKIA